MILDDLTGPERPLSWAFSILASAGVFIYFSLNCHITMQEYRSEVWNC